MTRKEAVLKVKQTHPQWSSSQVAAQVSLETGEAVSKDSVQKIIQRAPPFVFSADAQPLLPPAPLRDVGDKIVTGDVHVPDTDPAMVEKLIDAAHHFGIYELDVVGDLFNQDMMSGFPKVVQAATFQQELKAAKELLTYLKTVFKRVRWCRGNHDQRLIAMSNAQVSMENLAAMIGVPLETSACNFLWLESGGQTWMLAHQFEYKKDSLVKANELALIHQCNVISHHEHHAGMSRSVDGRWTIVNNPMLCNPPGYTQYNVTTRPRMQKGFTVVKDGWVDQYVEGARFGIRFK